MAQLTGDRTLDLGCALEGGAFEQVTAADQYEAGHIETAPPDLTLMFFVVRLFRRLQKIGTAPAIDIEAYAPVVFDSPMPQPSR